jgi:GntR family transcriptional regulator, carbon starvation induced regulator
MIEVMNETGTIASAVTERIRTEILDGTLRPGSKLKIGLVSERYAAGASPIREALNRLAADGLVTQHDQRGFTVAPISLEDLRELVKTRCWLEAIAIEQSIARRTAKWEEQLVLSYYWLSRTDRSVSPETYRTNSVWEKNHREFHAALLAACGSEHLLRYCTDLRNRADRYRQIAAAQAYPKRHEGDEHKAILDATIEGDAPLAIELLTSHYTTTLRIIEEHCSQMFDSHAAD